ncbi:type II toxin-antitoxin system HicB family antitoxin [Streptomyces sp. Amel2xC10]|uniref:type II toxin-antitoxin system HicB family antitoxin n=1 Tax=Streptomyces sp. Amel2xC10 TaxID=1305826 RepID=UPI000A08FAFB|nr:type II toxin-antitoxin system HicB family antitoxin [Streptomyces sp. Amel2xC10]SMF81005.1 Predicted nuclease of the RNAse H fold, HicB family [Streptomyces sp. Amel2xC10]
MRIIAVLYHQEGSSWWAESPDVSGFGAAGESLAEVRGLVHEGLPFYLEDEQFELREQLARPQVETSVKVLNATPSAPMWLRDSQDDVAPVVVVTGSTSAFKVVTSSPIYA